MIKQYKGFIIYLAALSVLAGYLFSKASWIGRIGIRLFYKQYSFLKTWWKGAGAVFMILLLLFAAHAYFYRKLKPSAARTLNITSLLLSLAGLFFTFLDFRHTLKHRWMGERFHLGAYCFWIGWISICILFLSKRKEKPVL